MPPAAPGRTRTDRTGGNGRGGAASATAPPAAVDRVASRAYVEHDGVNRHGDGRPRAPPVPVDQPNSRRDGALGRVTAVDMARGARPAARSARRQRSNVCSTAAGFAPISSQPGWSRSSAATRRRLARSRRRSRLRRDRRTRRAADRRTRRATATAAGSSRKVHHRVSVLDRRVRIAASVWNARRPRIVQIKPTGRVRPLSAPGLDDGPPGTGAHPGAKAVLAGPTAGVGLECALHGILDLSSVWRRRTAGGSTMARCRVGDDAAASAERDGDLNASRLEPTAIVRQPLPSTPYRVTPQATGRRTADCYGRCRLHRRA